MFKFFKKKPKQEKSRAKRVAKCRHHYISVDRTTKKIMNSGVSDCQETLKAQPVRKKCDLVEFQGGVKGQYFVDGKMQEGKPS